MVVVDNEQRVVTVNEMFCQTFHSMKEQALGQPLADVIALGSLEPALVESLRKHAIHRMRWTWTDPHGQERTFFATVNSITNLGEETPHQSLIALEDITERMATEWRYRYLMDNANDGIFVVSADSGQVLESNLRSAEMLGLASVDDLVGRSVLSFHPPEYRDVAKERLEQIEEQGSLIFDDLPWVRDDGSVIAAHLSTRLINLGGERVIHAVARDITEQKAGEQALRNANSQLAETLAELSRTQDQIIQQERLRALGTMASGIAHDFNNVLAPILGYSEMILEDANQFDETTVKYLREISTSANDAAAVVGRLREFYRHREGSELMVAVDLNDVVARVIALTQPRWRDMAQAKGIDIQLTTQLAADLPEVSGDEAELRTALGNVIFNAVDAMPDEGTITLRTFQDGEEVVLEVTDTGLGMSDEVLKCAVEPFFTTKEEQGTGMGLAMVYGTLQRHNGKLEIQSEEGQGTTVGFRLPIQTEDRDIPKTLEAEPLPAGLRFLVVDDESRVRDMVGEILRREGSTVETATDGREALEKFHQGQFDLVITDRGMPEMNGDALSAAIKEAAPNTPIIMLTGFGEMMISAGERPAGVDRLLGKPVTPAALRQAVTALRTEYSAAD